MEAGYLLSADHVEELQRVVRAHHSTPLATRRLRRRQPVFLPGAGGKVYQCVDRMRLKETTRRFPENPESREPVCLALPIGDSASGELRNMTHAQVRQIRDVIRTSGAIGRSGVIRRDAAQRLADNSRIRRITEEQFGEQRTVRVLRTRFLGAYAATGCIVLGNDSEVWSGGIEAARVTLTGAITDTDFDGYYTADLDINDVAITHGKAMEADRLTDLIVVRDTIAPLADLAALKTLYDVDCEFRAPVLMDEDIAYSDEHWYEDSVDGFLPVFDLTARPLDLVGKADSAITKGSSGTASVWTGESASGLTDSGKNLTGYCRYGDVGSGKWSLLRAHHHGWEIIQAEC